MLYFVFETALELTIRYAQTNEVGQHWKHMLSLPVGILNAIFYWWVLSSLAKLNLRLEEKKQLVKLKLYNQLTQVLLVSLGFSVFFALYEMYTSVAGDTAQMHWRHLWFLDAGFPTIMYTIILISLSFLLRPTKNHRRFAYTDLKRSQMMKQDSEYGMSELHELNSAGRDSSAYNGHVASQDDLEMPAAPRFTIDDEDCLSDDAGVGKGE